MTTRTTATTLRFLLLSAVGASLSACGGEGAGGNTMLGSGGGTTFPGSGGSTTLSGSCTNPAPHLDGVDTGIFRCEEGYIHRQEAKECPSNLPRPDQVDWPATGMGGAASYTTSSDECSSDADCGQHEQCRLIQTNAPTGCFFGDVEIIPDYARVCVAGCVTDSDCGPSAACLCGEDIGYCVPIASEQGCRSDADCAAGARCLLNARTDVFGPAALACELPGDECQRDVDCDTSFCQFAPTGRTCAQGAVCGRPFLVGDTALSASAVHRAWAREAEGIDLTALVVPEDPALRRALAEHWTRVGLLEHASIAAFARFTLQLLALGAPAELIAASNRAQQDETRHAELAFRLASRFAGRSVGPGSLELDGALADTSLATILRTTIEEGCLGETRAALEASWAAERCADPILRAVLETIAADEARHAELAWRVVRWILSSAPELVPLATEQFARAAEPLDSTRTRPRAEAAEAAEAAEHHGLLGAAALTACHRQAQRDVVAPCAASLLA